ncbi:MAG: SixA phosphatase family protein [Solirubrobacterales bacterium]
MRRLYLLRHAKSSWDDPALDDHERPLAPRGKRATKLMRKHLREERVEPGLALSSSAERAVQTLAGVRAGLPEATPTEIESSLYTFSATSLLSAVRRLDPGLRSVLVVGHNPAMQDLTLELAGDGVDLVTVARKFPTCALATLDFAGDWSELDSGVAALSAFVRPKDLKSAD